MHPKFEHYLLKPLLDSTVSLDASSDENDDMEEAVALSEASTQTPTVKASAHRQSSWGRKLLIFVLSALTVLSFVAVRIALPLYAGSANKAGGDDFTVLLYASMWHPVVMTTVTVVTKTFCDRSIALLPAVAWKVLILIGFLSTLNGTCFAFAADRTPPHIQALLLAARIPFTVVARMILLRKGKVFYVLNF
ncbi:hypothetical protein BaRGS_00022632 [Batillaria attramentaria]|uniref:PIN-like protein n=1 Tax=Batillaria attramentaria TaxID=370345 RepID=A0ABD0KGJ1_9CAEN